MLFIIYSIAKKFLCYNFVLVGLCSYSKDKKTRVNDDEATVLCGLHNKVYIFLQNISLCNSLFVAAAIDE